MKYRFFAVLVFLSLSAMASAQSGWSLKGSQGAMHFVHISESAWLDEDQYRLAVARICRGKQICQVLFWRDASAVPRSLPMTSDQEDAKIAHWQQNLNTGLRRWAWPCDLRPGPDCL